MNWYNYVGSDPINFTDPSGLHKRDFESCRIIDGTHVDFDGTIVFTGIKTCSTISITAPRTVTSDFINTGRHNRVKRDKTDCQNSSDEPGLTATDIAHAFGDGFQALGDVTQGVGVMITFVNPVAGGALIGVGKLTFAAGSAINFTTNAINGNVQGLAQDALSIVAGSAGKNLARTGAGLRINSAGRVIDSSGRFVSKANVAKIEFIGSQVGSKSVSGVRVRGQCS